MKKKIIGTIGVIWGAGIVVNWLLSNTTGSSEAYQAGQFSAVIIGAVLFFVSVYTFFKKPKDSS